MMSNSSCDIHKFHSVHPGRRRERTPYHRHFLAQTMSSIDSASKIPECPVCRLPLAESIQLFSYQHPCPFCRKTFGRADAARRHAKSCPQKGNRSLPPESKRGRKLRACDHCSRAKVSCDAKLPCSRCASRHQDCTYKWLCSDATHRQALNRPGATQRIPLSFLVNLTDPTQDFVTEEQVAREPESNVEGPAARLASLSIHENPEYIDPTLLFSSLLDPYLTASLDDDQTQDALGAFSQAPPNDRLATRVSLLTAELRDFASTESKYKGTFDEIVFADLFSSANVHQFAMAFSRKRHYQFPVIHWPTFDLEEAALPLLLAVALTGAAYSHRPGHHLDYASQARDFYGISNAYIFKRLNARAESFSARSGSSSSQHVEFCQAAILSYSMNTCLNDDYIRYMLVTKRLPTLVDAIRRFQFVGKRHETSEDWFTFVERESHIRLVAWTFLVDALVTLFCNNPPMMTLPEMAGHLPCSPELWDAESFGVFEKLRESEEEDGAGFLCLRDLVSDLLAEDWPGVECRPYSHLHFSHLHAVTYGKFANPSKHSFVLTDPHGAAFQAIVYNFHISSLPDSNAHILLRALNRWKMLWDAMMPRVSAEQRQWMGVTKFAPEVAWLTEKIIEVNGIKEAKGLAYLQRVPGYNLRAVHELIRHLQSDIQLRNND